MFFPDKKTVERVRSEYPAGTRVVLEKMDDLHAPPLGTMGTVLGVDDCASIQVRWDNGSGLNVVYGEDRVRRMVMTDKVFRAILSIRDSGKTNMIDTRTVQRIAFDEGFYELVTYLEEHRDKYVHFILHGTEG